MARFVRSSKFRHVFGTAAKRENCYDNLKITKSPHETNMCSVNGKFVAVVQEAQGGGSFLVFPLTKVRMRSTALTCREGGMMSVDIAVISAVGPATYRVSS